jgi:hypothetical protein
MLSRYLPRLPTTMDHADGVVRGTSGGLFFNLRARIGAAALAHKLPVMAYIAEEVPSGYLMSYGQDLLDFVHRAVAYADRILKGANPADLPVKQPTKFKLVLNLRTASALGRPGLSRNSRRCEVPMMRLLRSIFAFGIVAAVLCMNTRPSHAYQTGESEWCTITNIGGGDSHWSCDYDTSDECAAAVAGTPGGSCAINPYWRPDQSSNGH